MDKADKTIKHQRIELFARTVKRCNDGLEPSILSVADGLMASVDVEDGTDTLLLVRDTFSGLPRLSVEQYRSVVQRLGQRGHREIVGSFLQMHRANWLRARARWHSDSEWSEICRLAREALLHGLLLVAHCSESACIDYERATACYSQAYAEFTGGFSSLL